MPIPAEGDVGKTELLRESGAKCSRGPIREPRMDKCGALLLFFRVYHAIK